MIFRRIPQRTCCPWPWSGTSRFRSGIHTLCATVLLISGLLLKKSVVFVKNRSFLGTHSPREVCINKVINVDIPGQIQLFARRAYLNSSSQIRTSACSMCILVSARNICTYCFTFGAKSLMAQDRRIVCSSVATFLFTCLADRMKQALEVATFALKQENCRKTFEQKQRTFPGLRLSKSFL